MAKKEFDKFFDKELKMVARCPVCNTSHEKLKFSLVEENLEVSVLFLECMKCQSN